MGLQHNYGLRSLGRLRGVHSDLVLVCIRALQLCELDLTIVEGLRDEATQRRYVADGKSKTMNSKHLVGRAVDIAPLSPAGGVEWDNASHWSMVESAMKQAATELGVKIKWGGDWKTFVDKPHWELS